VSEFYINIALSILFQVLQDKKSVSKFKRAFSKLYRVLHENRVLFLSDSEFAQLVQPPLDGK
jgi:hypothetical protein